MNLIQSKTLFSYLTFAKMELTNLTLARFTYLLLPNF